MIFCLPATVNHKKGRFEESNRYHSLAYAAEESPTSLREDCQHMIDYKHLAPYAYQFDFVRCTLTDCVPTIPLLLQLHASASLRL